VCSTARANAKYELPKIYEQWLTVRTGLMARANAITPKKGLFDGGKKESG
jgi:hypothetical protein